MLCGSLDGWGVWGRMDTRIRVAESLHCLPETVTVLLISYTPIQNKKLKNETEAFGENENLQFTVDLIHLCPVELPSISHPWRGWLFHESCSPVTCPCPQREGFLNFYISESLLQARRSLRGGGLCSLQDLVSPENESLVLSTPPRTPHLHTPLICPGEMLLSRGCVPG